LMSVLYHVHCITTLLHDSDTLVLPKCGDNPLFYYAYMRW